MNMKQIVFVVLLLVAVFTSGAQAQPLSTGSLRETLMYADRGNPDRNIEAYLRVLGVPLGLKDAQNPAARQFPFLRAWSECAEFGVMHRPDFGGRCWRRLSTEEIRGLYQDFPASASFLNKTFPGGKDNRPLISAEDRKDHAARVCLAFQQLDLESQNYAALHGRIDQIQLTPGPAGPQGEQGIPGPQGEQGIPGPRGWQGEQGIPGPRGEQGIPGLDGAHGQRGSLWFTGNGNPDFTSVDGVVVQKWDHYRDSDCQNLWWFDGKRWQPSGCLMGPQGQQGIPGPAGPMGCPGPRGPEGPAAVTATGIGWQEQASAGRCQPQSAPSITSMQGPSLPEVPVGSEETGAWRQIIGAGMAVVPRKGGTTSGPCVDPPDGGVPLPDEPGVPRNPWVEPDPPDGGGDAIPDPNVGPPSPPIDGSGPTPLPDDEGPVTVL